MSSIAAPPLAQKKRKFHIAPYMLILPAIIVLLAALAYPVGWQIITSFQEYGLKQQFGQPPEWVGGANYVKIFTDPQIWAVILRSIAFCLVNAALTVIIGVALAVLMNSIVKGARLVLQVGLLLAWAMPVVAAMTVWLWLFNWYSGVINWVLGPAFANHNWLEDPISFYAVATIIVVWMSVPFVAFSVYAGLTQVSGEVLEAAQLDGANGWQRFTQIILPLIRPVLMIVLLLQIIWDLRVFTQIQMLQDAGADYNSTDLLGTFIYRTGAGSANYGMAAAMSVFVLVLTIVLSAPYVRSLLKEDNNG
ncbi:MAG: sugar ABC transporter permease [Propionibacteriaceae bacterium]|jgi:N,N'-diacetylchitobiose transport system permease protein|nr:sugar ABC transporter permease [Propionibacteriaceae bacterium]